MSSPRLSNIDRCRADQHPHSARSAAATAAGLNAQPKGDNTMNRRTMLTVAMTLLCLGVALPANHASAQQKMLKEQIVGTWLMVSNITTRDGTNSDTFGPNPKAILIFE